MAYLYRHVRLDKNVPFYIGVGNDNRNYRRAHDSTLRNIHWKNIVSKTKYDVEILLDGLSPKEALEKEKEFVKLYGRVVFGDGTLVNMTDGGDGASGFKWSEATKAKRKLNYKKENHHQFGRRPSEETCKKISQSNKGKKASSAVIEKIIAFNKSRKGTSQVKEMLLKCRKVIPVLQYNLQGFFISEYSSMSEAARSIGVSSTSIFSVCSGLSKSTKGFMWRCKSQDDYPKSIPPIGEVISKRNKKYIGNG